MGKLVPFYWVVVCSNLCESVYFPDEDPEGPCPFCGSHIVSKPRKMVLRDG